MNSDDLKTRETAEAELIAAGPSIGGVLQSMLPQQPPEARDAITRILKNLRKGVTGRPESPDPTAGQLSSPIKHEETKIARRG